MPDTTVKSNRPKIKPIIAGKKLRGAEEMARIPVKIEQTVTPLRKPDWIRIRLPTGNKVNELKVHDCDMITLGQYLQPSLNQLPVERYVHPDEFDHLQIFGEQLGFKHVASGPMVRSSYHADEHTLEAEKSA
jgi:lipoate synthase